MIEFLKFAIHEERFIIFLIILDIIMLILDPTSLLLWVSLISLLLCNFMIFCEWKKKNLKN